MQSTKNHGPWSTDALILGLPPELVFDQGIGDLFVTRTAGAVLDDTLVGSMEFAVSSPYEVPVIVILGHTACGAVTGTVEALEKNAKSPKAPGEMIDFISEIAPAAREAEPVPDKSEHINNVVRMNTVAVAAALVERSEIIRAAVNAGRTEVIAAVYDLQTGLVDWNLTKNEKI
ncbi:carbonic anhydrase [Glutamicibacter sp. AOP38-B1-38]